MNTAPTRRAVAAGASVLALASLSACGQVQGFMPGENDFLKQSASSIAKASFEDMRDVTSMRILGDTDSRKDGRMRVDISVGEGGCSGTITTKDGGFELRQNADGTWFKGDEDFWRARAGSPTQGDQLWKQARGAWVPLEGKDSFLELCDLDGLLSDFAVDTGNTDDTIDVDDVVTVGDAEAIPLTGQDGKDRTTIWVAVDAPHRVLKMAPASDTGMPDALFFEEFDADVVVETPAKKDILELTQARI